MLDSQLRPNKINDLDIIARFNELPREDFVEGAVKELAYADQPVSMGHGRRLFAPHIAARLLQAASPLATDHVLVAAAGTGFTAAVLSPLVEYVVNVEENPYLLDAGRKAHSDLHLKNVKWVKETADKGCKAHAPYDLIVLDAPAEVVPEALAQQLKEGGRMVAILLAADGLYRATLLTKNAQTLFAEYLFETHQGEALAAFKKTEAFVF